VLERADILPVGIPEAAGRARNEHGQGRQANAARQDLQRQFWEEAPGAAAEESGCRTRSGGRAVRSPRPGTLTRRAAEAAPSRRAAGHFSSLSTMCAAWRRLLAAAALLAALGCSPQFDWREVRGEQGFTASLPGRAQAVTRDITIAGERVSMTMWSTGIGPTMFAVGVVRLPPAAIADEAARMATIAYFREALVRNIGADPGTVRSLAPPPLPSADARKPLAATAVEAEGRPGADGRKSRLAARFFIVDDRFFQVVALGAEGAIPPDVLETFFTSFRLLS
jgi:hypothetical protein